ncbi:MAG TPA: murein biosynthesis integral membrane protein MurJ [bacterium]|nr:murein biosynthesis integral membrane protein MurJ [bacterium]
MTEISGILPWKRFFKWGAGIAGLAVLSRCSGLIREMVVAHCVGIGESVDVYYLASAVPLFVAWMGDAATTQTVLPLFTRRIEADSLESAWRLACGVLWIALLIVAVPVVAATVAPLALWRAISASDGASNAALARMIILLSLPVMLVQTVGGWQTGILQSRKRFFLPAAIPMAYNLALVFVLLVGARHWGVLALAVGLLAAEAMRTLLQWPTLVRMGIRMHHVFRPDWTSARRSLTHLIPIASVVGLQQIVFITDRLMAKGLPEGSVSALAYGHRLLILPYSMLVAAVATPLFSMFSECAAQDDIPRLKEWVVGGLRLMIRLGLPITLMLVVLRVPLVRMLFQHGAFDEHATQLASSAVLGYGMSLVFFAVLPVLSQYFYAVGEVRTPLLASGVCAVLNIGLNTLFRDLWSHAGIAVASAISFAVCAGLHLPALQKRLGSLAKEGHLMLREFLLSGLAMGFCMAVCLVLAQRMAFSRPIVADLVTTTIVGGVGVLAGLVVWRLSKR